MGSKNKTNTIIDLKNGKRRRKKVIEREQGGKEKKKTPTPDQRRDRHAFFCVAVVA